MDTVSVGVFYNLRKDYSKQEGQPVDIDGDWDIPDTVQEIISGLKSNFEVLDFGDPKLLMVESVRKSIDIVFSICEMQGFRFRESIVPCLCELLQLPYVFSPPDAMMISLDKNLCNMIVQQVGCRVPEWQLVRSPQEVDSIFILNYPYIVKPSCEGSGIGITDQSVVYNKPQLFSQVEFVVESYLQPALVQQFIPGREFTVGVIEVDGRIQALEPMELHQLCPVRDFTYNHSVKEIADQRVIFKPLKSEPELRRQICRLAGQSFEAIGCRDAGRVDIRLSTEGVPFFLEINPLPHLHPVIGDFCRSAKASNISYRELMATLVNNAARRYGLI
jgi:D-alanine--D-alanine ligase